MEPKFELQFPTTHKMFAEFYRFAIKKLLTIGTVALGLMLLVYLPEALRDEVEWTMVAACVLLIVFYAAMPDLIVWANRRQQKKKHGGVLPPAHIIIGDTVEDISGTIKVSFGFDNITRVVRLKHSYVLMLDKRTGILLDPNGFTKGTFAEFKQHLREKCPNLLIPE